MSNFKRLDDYTQAELANLTKQETEDLIALELAFAGITEVPPPTVKKPELIIPDISTAKTFYQIGDLYFSNMETAQKVLDLRPSSVDYISGFYDFRFEKEESYHSISTCKLYPKEEILRVSNLRKATKSQSDLYNTQNKEYEDFLDKKSKIVEKVTSRIYEAQRFLSRATDISNSFNKYFNLIKDHEIALTLVKDNYSSQEKELEYALENLISKPEVSNDTNS